MALQIALPDTNVGLPAPQAYARIVAVRYDVLTNEVEVAVNIYATRATRDAGKTPVDGDVYKGIVGVNMPSLDDALAYGVRAALYTWLKMLPDFQGSIDV